MSNSTILCVDDEDDILLTLSAVLEWHFPDYRIETAKSGAQALELVDKLVCEGVEIPLVITDQMMPRMNGDQFLIELHARHPEIIKVMLTGRANAEDVGNVVNRGNLYRFIAKPWDNMDLQLTVTEALRRYQQERQIAQQQAALEKANRELAALNADLEQRVLASNQELRKNEQLLRLFVERAPAAVAMFDRQMRYLLVSERWKLDYHLGDRDIIGRSHYDIFPTIPDRWRQIHQRCLAGVSERSEEDYFVNSDGTVIWVQWEILPWYTEAGDIGGIILFSQDITERKLAQQALQESEANLKKAQEIARLGNWEYNFATEQVYWSEEIYRFHGLNLNQPILIGEDAKRYIHPDDHAKYQQEILEKIVVGESFVTDLRILHKDGSIRFVESRGEPFFDAQNQLIGYRGTIQDITDRKQAEEAFKKSESRFRRIADSNMVGIILTTTTGEITKANDEFLQIIGYDRADLLAGTLRWDKITPPEYKEVDKAAVADLLTYGCVQPYEKEYFRKDGSRVAVLIGAALIEGSTDQLIGLILDISDRKQAEEALRESEERLRLALEAAQMGTWDWNILTNQVIWSESLERLTGLQPGTFDGRFESVSAMIYPDDRQRVVEAITRSVEQGDEYNIEFRFVKPDGSIRWAAGKGNVLRDRSGRAVRMLGVDVDITDRKLSELALRESEARFAAIFQSSPDAIVITRFSDGLILDFNNQFTQISGYTRSEAIGHTTLELQFWLDPAVRTSMIAHLQTELIMQNKEYSFRRKSGEIFVGLFSWQVIDLGGQTCILGVVRDISDRKRLELALEKSEAKLREVLDSTIAGIMKLRFYPDGSIVYDYISPYCERIYDYTAQEFMADSKLWISRIHPEDYQGNLFSLQQTMLTQVGTATYSIEYRFRCKDDSIRWVLANLWVQWDAVGGYWNITVVDTDITDRKQTELALKESEERFLELSQASPANIYIIVKRVDGSFYFEHISQAIETIHEIPVEQFLENGNIILDCIHPEDLAGYQAKVQHSQETLQPFCHEWRIITPSSTIKWIQGNSRPKLRDNGEIVWYGVVLDISDRKQAEEALRQSEERWHLGIEGSNDGIWDRFLNNSQHFLSPRCLEMLGYDYEEIDTYQKWFSYIHPDDQELVKTTSQAYFDRQTPIYVCEYRMRCHDGSYKWILARAKAIWDETGTPVRLVGSLTDTTIRRQAELALQQLNEELEQRVQQRTQELARSEQDLRTIFNNVYDAILIHDMDGTVLDLNDRALELRGATREQLLGAKIADFSAPDAPIERIPEILERAQAGETLRFEWRERRFSNDSLFDVEVSLRMVTLDNRPVFVAGVRDISDRKQAELALRASEQRYATLAAISPVAIFRFDKLLNCTYISDRWSEMTGRPVKSGLGLGWINALHPDDREQVLKESIQSFAQLPPGSQVFNFGEGRHLRSDGSINWFYVQVAQEFDPNGRVIGYIGTMTDITKRKEYEAQLQKTNEELIRATRLKDEFLATMSHEFRTPLNAVLGMTEALQDGFLGEINERQLGALKTIETSGSHLLELINDILDLTKIESSQMELNCVLTTVAPLCQSALSFIKPQARKKRIHLELKLPPNLPVISVDERRIRQVLINLLNNAVKFTSEAGCITLEVSYNQKPARDSSAPNFLRIAVIDTGIGIASKDMNKLFQPFVQIDSTLNRKYEGTGLGLTLVKRFVELHGGQVGVTSEVGVGSCFTIDLPYTPCATSSPQPETQLEPNTKLCQDFNEVPPLILLAEDNEANISTMVSYLRAKGYRLVVARDGQEAIAVAQSQHPDLMLINIQMSGNGLEAMQQIRGDSNLANVHIIALSPQAMSGDQERCLAAGANDYLSKPVNMKQLVTKIELGSKHFS